MQLSHLTRFLTLLALAAIVTPKAAAIALGSSEPRVEPQTRQACPEQPRRGFLMTIPETPH